MEEVTWMSPRRRKVATSDEVDEESKNLSLAQKIRALNQKKKGLNDAGEEDKSDTNDDENYKHSDVDCASDGECENNDKFEGGCQLSQENLYFNLRRPVQ